MQVNVLVVSNVEVYYYMMIINDNELWNICDCYMVEVLKYI